MSDRAVAPALGAVLVIAITVTTAAVVGAAVTVEPPGGATVERVAFETAADETGEIRVTHLGGDPIAPDDLRLELGVDGEPLAEQPPVPFFSAPGFESGPTGAFNSATADAWRAGETAALRIAETNEPTLEAGSTVEIRIYVGEMRVAAEESAVQPVSVDSVAAPDELAGSSGTYASVVIARGIPGARC